ncbi:DUF397 domain-containing protein [Streptomyces sp. NPDC050145]|uniref:DUF397 domain-containing protein n=1 Tax=Streptomyces sp. NPDC050145 TaxID=3365602 RepID=UPI0037974239
MSDDARLSWFRSTYSDSQGGNCVEAAMDWRKSSHSDDQGGNCVEIATLPTHIHIRDSKLGPQSPTFVSTASAWTAFLAHACATRTA